MERIILRSRLLWLLYDVSCCARQGGNATVHRSVAKKKKKETAYAVSNIICHLFYYNIELMPPPSDKYHPYEIIDSFFLFFTSSFVSSTPT